MSRFLIIVAGLALAACATRPMNQPIDPESPVSAQYRFENLALNEGNSDETFVILALSGGGTRSAAFAYGVVRALAEIRLANGQSLLDEVDVISAVSGSSVVPAAYASWGSEVFFESFEDRFLRFDLESPMRAAVLSPLNWPALFGSQYARSDLFAEVFDEQLFDGATFGSLPLRRPLVIINATDMSIGANFTFTQDQFDALCSDLGSYPLANAVVASIALPGPFTPITLRNYPSESCGYERPAWATEALAQTSEVHSRLYVRARNLATYEDQEARPYIHLLDGGLSDNIGIRAPGVSLLTEEIPASILSGVRSGRIRQVLLIAVDAMPGYGAEYDMSPATPGDFASLRAASGDPLRNYSFETVRVWREYFDELERERDAGETLATVCVPFARRNCADARCVARMVADCQGSLPETAISIPPDVTFHVAHLSFDLADEATARRLSGVPTRLSLADEQVDFLIEEGGRTPYRSLELLRFLDDQEAPSGGPRDDRLDPGEERRFPAGLP